MLSIWTNRKIKVIIEVHGKIQHLVDDINILYKIWR